MLKNILTKNQFWIYILVLAGVCVFLSFVNIPYGKDFIGNDSSLLYYSQNLSDYYYSWNNLRFGRYAASDYMSLYLYILVLLFQFFYMPVANVLYFLYLLLFLAGTFFLVYYFLRLVIKDNNFASRIPIVSFFCSFLGFFNSAYLTISNYPITNFQLAFAAQSAFTAICLKVLSQNRVKITDFLIFNFLFFFIIGGNPANNLVFFPVLFLILLSVYSFVSRSGYLKLFFLGISGVLIQSYQLIFYLYNWNPYEEGLSTGEIIVSSIQSLKFNSLRSNFLNLFRLDGAPTFNQSPNYSYFSGIYYQVFGYVPIIFITLAGLCREKNKGRIVAILLVGLLGLLFFAKGFQNPGSFINVFFFEKIAAFGVFRAVVYKFFLPAVLFIVLLSGLFIISLKKKFIFVMALVFLFLYYLPYFYVLVLGKEVSVEYLSTIPPEYKSLSVQSDYFNGNKNFLSPLPSSGSLTTWFTGASLYNYFTKEYVIVPESFGKSFKYEFPTYNNQLILNKPANFDTFSLGFLANFNIGAIILQKDVAGMYDFGSGGGLYNFNGVANYRILSEKLEADPKMALIDKNNSFDLYKVKELPPLIFIPKKIVTATFSSQLRQILTAPDYISQTAIYFIDAKWPLKTGWPLDLFKNIPGSVDFSKVNPTKYNLHFSQVRGKIPVVFSQSYHRGWELYPAVEADHFLVNGYANAWIFDTNIVCKKISCQKNSNGTYDFNVVLEFWPQRLFTLGLLISGLTLVGCLIIIGRTYIKK